MPGGLFVNGSKLGANSKCIEKTNVHTRKVVGFSCSVMIVVLFIDNLYQRTLNKSNTQNSVRTKYIGV